MEKCIKCSHSDIKIEFKHIGQKIYWSQHKEIKHIDQFTRNDRYYTSDIIIKECLVYTCKTCGFKKAIKTKQ